MVWWILVLVVKSKGMSSGYKADPLEKIEKLASLLRRPPLSKSNFVRNMIAFEKEEDICRENSMLSWSNFVACLMGFGIALEQIESSVMP